MADTQVLTPKDDLAPSAPSEDKPAAEALKEEKAETPSDDSQPPKQKNSERNGKDGNRPNKNQNQQPKRKDTTIKDLIASIPQFADIGSLEKEVNDLSKYANGLPGKLVPANNPQKPIGPVRLNMIRATDIAAGVIQKYNSQSKQLETLKNNENVLQQLANEYTDTFTTYENLIANLETLVNQLTTENTVLKQLLQSNNIPIPAPEEKKKVENKPAPKQNAQKKPKEAPKKTQEQDGGKSSPATKKATPPKSAEPAASQPAETEAVKSEKPKNSPQPGANKQKNSPATKKSNTGKAGSSDAAPAAEGEKPKAPVAEGEKPKNSPQPKKNAKNPANSETNNGASADAAAKPGNKTPNQQKNKKQQQNKPAESEPAAS